MESVDTLYGVNDVSEFDEEEFYKEGSLFSNNEILLGLKEYATVDELLEMSDEDIRSLAVTIPFNDEPLNIVGTGMQGSGKSYLLGAVLFIDNFMRRVRFTEDNKNIRLGGMIIDPSGEYASMQKLVRNKNILEFWDRLGFPMNELKIQTYRPLPCAYSYKRGGKNLYQLDLTKITVSDLISLLDLNGAESSRVARRRRLREAIRRYYATFFGRRKAYPDIDTSCPPISVLIENLKEGRMGTSDILIEELENLRFEGFIGKNPPAQTVESMARNEIPCIHTTVDVSLSKRMRGIIQIEIEKIIKERQKDYEGVPSKIPFPVQLLIDEFNIVGSRTQFEFFKNIYDQMRKYGIGICGIVPSLVDLHETVIKQSDYIICAKIMPYSREEDDAKKRLGNLLDVTLLTDLYDPGKNLFPKEFALIDRSGNVERFYPMFSISEHKGQHKKKFVAREIEMPKQTFVAEGETIEEDIELLGEPTAEIEAKKEELIESELRDINDEDEITNATTLHKIEPKEYIETEEERKFSIINQNETTKAIYENMPKKGTTLRNLIEILEKKGYERSYQMILTTSNWFVKKGLFVKKKKGVSNYYKRL